MEKDPIELHYAEEQLYRGTGRTKRMINSLPEYNKYVVIVSNQKMKNTIKKWIEEIRGEVANRAVFVTYDEYKRGKLQTMSMGVDAMPVYVDHNVQHIVINDFLRDVNYFYLVDKNSKLYVKNNEGAI